METPTDWPVAVRLIAVLVPSVPLIGALLASRDTPFRAAKLAAWVTALLALVVALAGPTLAATASTNGGLAALVRVDAVTSGMLCLVGGLGVVIVRYSDPYLRGDPGRRRYVRALLVTLACVLVLVLTNHLLVLALAWMGSSLALHQLLTHFPDRLQARVAAHKKFILSRIADGCVLTATGLFAWAAGAADLDALHGLASAGALPLTAQAAALLLVAGVTLKTAQLPFHGWLTQVMEAPTPVSALLHAGVVNIGGLVLIRLAPVMVEAAAASALLVLVGTITAVVAALVMTTRISVKVGLAWSTAAQMGLMLVQCGLGLWHLAFLHLLAHSVYKAHAFLSAGGTVDAWRVKSISPTSRPPSLAAVLAAAVLTVPLVFALGWATSPLAGGPGVVGPLAIVLGLALAPLLASSAAAGPRALGGGVLIGAVLIGLTFAWHLGFEALHVGPEPGAWSEVVGWAVVVPGFMALFLLQSVLAARPDGALARVLHPHLAAGLYLDALFTRLTFRVWPPRLPPRRARLPATLSAERLES